MDYPKEKTRSLKIWHIQTIAGMLKPTDQLITGCSGKTNERQRQPRCLQHRRARWQHSSQTVSASLALLTLALLTLALCWLLLPESPQGHWDRRGNHWIKLCFKPPVSNAPSISEGNKAVINSALWGSGVVGLWSHLSLLIWSFQSSHTMDGYTAE